MITALWLLAGLLAGVAHFRLLRWNADLYVTGAVARPLIVQALRLAATTALLVVAALHGAMPLLATALGVLLARWLVVRVVPVAP